jgi:hypothetical protein
VEQEVGGSSPPNCTSKIKYLGKFASHSLDGWEAGGKASLVLRIRHAIGLPIYLISQLLDYASVALGRLAAVVAGDDWPG